MGPRGGSRTTAAEYRPVDWSAQRARGNRVLPAQQSVGQPEQEREERGGVVGSSYRVAVRRPMPPVVGRVLLHRGVAEERATLELV